MTVVVLGSHGFLGSNLTSFLNEDFEVVGLNRENLDLNDEQEIKKVLMGINPNYVLLAAGKVGGIGANLNNNFLFFDSNLAIQRNVFNACLDLDIKNIIFFASNTIYPNNIEAPFRENDLDLNNIDSSNYGYSLSKIVGGVVKSGVHACLSRRRSRVRIPSSPQLGQIAQSVEHLSEKQGVGSSILPLATGVFYFLVGNLLKDLLFFYSN